MSAIGSTSRGALAAPASFGVPRALRVGLGLVTAVAGGVILAWPGGTLVAVAVIVGIQFIVVGVVRAVTAFTFAVDSVAARVLFLLLGILLVVVGILCLRSPTRTIALLVLLFGISCVISGALDLFHGFTGGGGWAIASGLVSIAIGVVVLVYPVTSVSTMVWLFGIGLVLTGLIAILGAFVPRRG
ncbi:HdeD family acid-resistance protein [Actinophytocola sp.]|uniref:HdeD family acid-resistance protein n=1 Tax=Actinophytocola sp. TaxID=1872138 RepID=UPI00389AB01A